VRRTQHTNFNELEDSHSHEKLAFIVNILSLTAKSGSYCDACFLFQHPNFPATINTKKPLPVIGTYFATVFGFTLTRR
jgi:hypothetical protein